MGASNFRARRPPPRHQGSRPATSGRGLGLTKALRGGRDRSAAISVTRPTSSPDPSVAGSFMSLSFSCRDADRTVIRMGKTTAFIKDGGRAPMRQVSLGHCPPRRRQQNRTLDWLVRAPPSGARVRERQPPKRPHSCRRQLQRQPQLHPNEASQCHVAPTRMPKLAAGPRQLLCRLATS